MVRGEVLPFSQACENNKAFIAEYLQVLFAGCSEVLEIASGSGQHATFFADLLPTVRWQPTEIPANMTRLTPRCKAYTGTNLLPPRPLDVCARPWSVNVPDAIFTANSLHIMPLAAVQQLFFELGQCARAGTLLAVYGPFNYNGQYTSEGNAQFDIWLAAQHPKSAIRDFEQVIEWANEAGFVLADDHSMPANNRLLVWRRGEVGSV
ncbi:MAG: hypothetical protein ACI8QT_001585 [Halioglobus sp.]|jgi:hypothetical protein